MSFKLHFLGTGGMVPTKERNVQSIYLDYKGEGILLDCGEGAQRQMNIAGIARTKIKKILITHWHGDHVSGLIGLIQTIGNAKEVSDISIYGPIGTKKFVNNLLNSCIFDLSINLNVIELDLSKKKIFFENDYYYLEAAPLNHSVPCLGYSFVEKDRRRINMVEAEKRGLSQGPELGEIQKGLSVKIKNDVVMPDDVSTIVRGKKVTLIADTSFSVNAQDLASESDLLICEATYMKKEENKADEYSHLTSEQSALIASHVGAKKLVLTHFSQRYKDLNDLLEEAKNIFPQTQLAYDFMKFKI